SMGTNAHCSHDLCACVDFYILFNHRNMLRFAGSIISRSNGYLFLYQAIDADYSSRVDHHPARVRKKQSPAYSRHWVDIRTSDHTPKMVAKHGDTAKGAC